MNFHYLQLIIIKKLALKPYSIFKDLEMTEHDSNLISYHLKVLKDQSLIDRDSSNKYFLTLQGKKLAVMLETHSFTPSFPFQGQSAVMCATFLGENINSKVVIQTRQKDPYFGFVGLPTKKIIFGETILEAATNCMHYETKLTSKKLEYKGYIHWINLMHDEAIEDKFMHIVNIYNAKGELQEQGESFTNKIGKLAYLENSKNKIYSHSKDILKIIKSGDFLHWEVRKVIDSF